MNRFYDSDGAEDIINKKEVSAILLRLYRGA